jgi:hypothetical protein
MGVFVVCFSHGRYSSAQALQPTFPRGRGDSLLVCDEAEGAADVPAVGAGVVAGDNGAAEQEAQPAVLARAEEDRCEGKEMGAAAQRPGAGQCVVEGMEQGGDGAVEPAQPTGGEGPAGDRSGSREWDVGTRCPWRPRGGRCRAPTGAASCRGVVVVAAGAQARGRGLGDAVNDRMLSSVVTVTSSNIIV